ncbi:MAG: LTA synthase family protein, partial [Sphingobacterium sp.]
MLIYSLLRIGFYGFNYTHFPQVTFSGLMVMMKGGVIFDVAAILYLNILYILMQVIPSPLQNNNLYKNIGKWIFIGSNAIGVALNLADFAYYPFTLKRTTGTIFNQFSNEENIFKLFFDFLIDYWYILILFVFLIWILIKSYSWIIIKPVKMTWKYYVVQLICLLFSAALFIGGVRGGWAHSTR